MLQLEAELVIDLLVLVLVLVSVFPLVGRTRVEQLARIFCVDLERRRRELDHCDSGYADHGPGAERRQLTGARGAGPPRPLGRR